MFLLYRFNEVKVWAGVSKTFPAEMQVGQAARIAAAKFALVIVCVCAGRVNNKLRQSSVKYKHFMQNGWLNCEKIKIDFMI